MTGVFLNIGATSSKNPEYSATLDGSVFGKIPVAGLTETVNFDFQASNSTLYIQFNGKSDDQVHPSGKFDLTGECSDGWLKIEKLGTGYVDGTYSKSKTIILMSIAEDGHLIVHYEADLESKSLGIFKSRRMGDTWYLFDRLNH